MPKNRVRDTLLDLKRFARHPLDEIARLPSWSLKRLLITHWCAAAVSGVLSGLWAPGLWKVLQGLFLFPILAILMNSVLASFFYYYFQIFERRTVSFVRLLHLIFFAALPFFLFHVASGFFLIADVFGLAMTAILLVIGLTENFQLEKKRSLRVVAVIFGLLFVMWLAERISSASRDRLVSWNSETPL